MNEVQVLIDVLSAQRNSAHDMIVNLSVEKARLEHKIKELETQYAELKLQYDETVGSNPYKPEIPEGVVS